MTNQFKSLRNHIVALQAISRGYLLRKEFKSRQRAAIKIQAFIRSFIARKKYLKLREENQKLFEALKLKEQEEYMLMKKMNPKKAKEIAEQKFHERIQEFEIQRKEEEIEDQKKIAQKKAAITDAVLRQEEMVDDSKLVDAMFDFLPRTENQVENNGPSVFSDLERINGDAPLDSDELVIPQLPEEETEDLTEYKFQKFASTYFQANVTHQYQRRPLKQPLLALKTQGDCMASIALWITILRFMGDLGEPNFHTLGRVSFNLSDLL